MDSSDKEVATKLAETANTFVNMQQHRPDADYNPNPALPYTRTPVLELIGAVEEAFYDWAAVRDTEMARSFLVSLLDKRHIPQRVPKTR